MSAAAVGADTDTDTDADTGASRYDIAVVGLAGRFPGAADIAAQLLTLSAAGAAAARRAGGGLAAHLDADREIDLADLAHTARIGRRALRHRRALVCRDRADALVALRTRCQGFPGGVPATAVCHAAAWVNFTYPYAALKRANVFVSEEMLRLAASGRPKPLHFISSGGDGTQGRNWRRSGGARHADQPAFRYAQHPARSRRLRHPLPAARPGAARGLVRPYGAERLSTAARSGRRGRRWRRGHPLRELERTGSEVDMEKLPQDVKYALRTATPAACRAARGWSTWLASHPVPIREHAAVTNRSD